MTHKPLNLYVILTLISYIGNISADATERPSTVDYMLNRLELDHPAELYGLTPPDHPPPVANDITHWAQFQFSPSFHPRGTLTIMQNADGLFYSLQIGNAPEQYYQSKIKQDDLKSLFAIIPKYKNSEKKSFIRYNVLDGMWWTADLYDSSQGRVTLLFGNASNESPRNDFAKALYDCVYKIVDQQEVTNYIEQIERYLLPGPHVKIDTRSVPIVVRLYAGLGWDYHDEIEEILFSLPMNVDIIIDMSNFNRMGTAYYSLFERFIETYDRLTWIAEKSAREQLLEIGVKPQNIQSKQIP